MIGNDSFLLYYADSRNRQEIPIKRSRLPAIVAANLMSNFDEAYSSTHVEEQLFDEGF